MWCLAGAAVLYMRLEALNASLSCTGALCELDATPSMSVDITFTEQRVRCAVNLLIHSIYTVFMPPTPTEIYHAQITQFDLYHVYPKLAQRGQKIYQI